MAATPKPIREKQKKGMAMQKTLRASENKVMNKEAKKQHMTKVSVDFPKASKHDKNMIKRSYPTSSQHSKSDLAKAHQHMKKHSK